MQNSQKYIMQPRLNIAKSAGELIEEEVRRFFINKSTDALRNMPVREILTSKAVEHINTYYKLGVDDYIEFNYTEDKERLGLEDPNIIYNKKVHPDDAYIWMINFIHDYDNFCRKLPFWTLSLSVAHKEKRTYSEGTCLPGQVWTGPTWDNLVTWAHFGFRNQFPNCFSVMLHRFS